MHLNYPVVSTLSLIPAGVRGIHETLKTMSQLTRDGAKNYAVHMAAISRSRSCPQKDYACEVRCLHAFVRDGIRYVQDPKDVERVQSPDVTLQIAAGDCDDKSVLLASLLEAMGHPTRFVAIGFEPGIFSHVYVETKIGARWIPLETTEPVAAGWEPDPALVKARKEFYN